MLILVGKGRFSLRFISLLKDLKNHSVVCLFTFLMVKHMKHKSLTFWRSLSCFFSCVVYVFVIIYKKQLPNPRNKSQKHLLLLIHFVILYMVWGRSLTLFFCKRISNCPNSICWKDYSFLSWVVWHLCQKSLDCKCKGLFLDYQFFSIDLYVNLFASII